MADFEIWQECSGHWFMVAGASGSDRRAAWREACHYAMIYSQDGPIKIYEKIGTKRRELSRTVGIE